MCTKFKTFCNYVRKEFNIGFKVLRSDQCNYCALIEKWISECTNPKQKEKLQYYLDCHKHDAKWCQDFMYWMFQKSYAQQGKEHQEWESLQVHQEYIE